MTDVTMDKIVSLCRRRGFVFPSSEIYGGLGSTYDYGHYGVLMKNHIRSLWLRAMVQERDDIVAIDSAMILNPRVWEASGHVAGFSDPLDRLPHVQAALPRRPARGRAVRQEAVEAAGRDSGVRPHRAAPVQPDVRDAGRRDGGRRRRRRISARRRRRASSSTSRTCSQLARRKPPFGIAQVGKSFRNEITPGNFLFRVREFEQMEMEYFVPPDEAEQWYAYWIEQRSVVPRPRAARASSCASASTTGGALALLERHERHRVPVSDRVAGARGRREPRRLRPDATHAGVGHEARVRRPGRRALHAVRDRAGGLDRADLRRDALRRVRRGGRRRARADRHAPASVGRAGEGGGAAARSRATKAWSTRARALFEELRRRHTVEYDDSGQIGRRYRRQDEIGTPWAFTIDDQTLEDETVTVRDRDSLSQERLPISGVAAWLDDALQRRGGHRRHDARRSRGRSCSPSPALRRHEDRHGPDGPPRSTVTDDDDDAVDRVRGGRRAWRRPARGASR